LDKVEMIKAVLGNLWLDSAAYENVGYVVDNFGNRFMGTESERKTKDYLLTLFKQYGLENVHAEPYKYIGWKRGKCIVEMIHPVKRELWSAALPHSASTSSGGIEARVIDLGSGTKKDFEQKSNEIKGNIVLAPASSSHHVDMAARYGWAIEHKAAGCIFRNDFPGQLIRTGAVATGYRNTGVIPAISVSYETGAFMERQMRSAQIIVKMEIENSVLPNTTGWNIIGDIIGERGTSSMVMMGTHYDGHDISQEAASDNILGVAVMLDAAKALAKFKGKFKKTIRLVAFGNDECLTVGTVNYVAQHEKEMQNVDVMVGDGLGRSFIDGLCISAGPPALATPLLKLLKDWKIDLPVEQTDEDWVSATHFLHFALAGIPNVDFERRRLRSAWYGTDPRDETHRHHTTTDTFDKIDPVLVKQHAIFLAELVLALANMSEPLLKHPTREEIMQSLRSHGYDEILKAQNRWHPGSILGH
jgi:hypothetical protein